MNKKEWKQLEEQTKDMTPENKFKYTQFIVQLKRSTEIDWGFVLMILGLSLMAVSYFLKILDDFGVIVLE